MTTTTDRDLRGLNFEEGYIAVIDKPLEWTSTDVVRKIKFALHGLGYRRIKVGHAGTLDPLATGILGFIDDASKVAHERSLGLTPKAKLVGQFLIAGIFVLCAVNLLDVAPTVEIPFICTIDLGVLTTVIPLGGETDSAGISIPWLYLAYCLILLVGLCNAVNLTDGLDGLASSVTVLIATFFTVVAFGTHSGISPITCAVVGSLMGFLLFNVYPASVFMGDTGSLALGGFVASTAYMLKMPMLIYWVEILSVMIQVTYFKLTGGKRIFRMAPIHHHFELGGWSETRVVAVFSIITAVLCLIGILAL